MRRTADKKTNHKIMGLDNHKKAKRAQNKGSRSKWKQLAKYMQVLEG